MKVIEDKSLQAQLQSLYDELNHLKDDDIYGTKRTYLQYKIELLEKDIYIEKLQQALIVKSSTKPMEPLLVKYPLHVPTSEEICERLNECWKKWSDYAQWHWNSIRKQFEAPAIHKVLNKDILVLSHLPLDLAHAITTFFKYGEE